MGASQNGALSRATVRPRNSGTVTANVTSLISHPYVKGERKNTETKRRVRQLRTQIKADE